MTKTIEQYNDLLAPIYDEKTPEFHWAAPQESVEIVKKNVTQFSWNILDIWCWTGQILDYLWITPDSYTWVDISWNMVKQFKSKYPNLQCLKSDIETDTLENLENWTVDIIFMSWVFEFIINKERLIKLVNDKLKKGWYFCFTFENYVEWDLLQWSKHSPMWQNWDKPIHPVTDFDNFRYSGPEIESILKDYFQIIDSKEFVWYEKTEERLPIQYTVILGKKK